MIDPPLWTEKQLELDRKLAIEAFRDERMREPLEAYLEAFDEYQGIVEDLLETTIDLTDLDQAAVDVLTDENLLEAFRYLPGPPISKDDLETLAEAVLSPYRLREDVAMVRRIVTVIRTQLDRRRFLWVAESREPTEAERGAAVLASAALLATQRLSTNRRNFGKQAQEDRVEEALLAGGLKKVTTRWVKTLSQAPSAGEFCRECKVGSRKADFIVGLYDDTVMAIECKVSNSATNSIKRLNNDAAAKAVAWKHDFGHRQIVPTAVLSGVYNTHNLVDAQARGLTIFWAHGLKSLTKWISRTRPQRRR
jgi:hypothetical protein